MSGAAGLLGVIRKTANVGRVREDAIRPFRFFLCGDPALVADFRMLLLSGRPESNVPAGAPATLETIDPERRQTVSGPDARLIVFLGRPGDLAGAGIDLLRRLRLPIFALTVGPGGTVPSAAPSSAPQPGHVAEYAVPRIDRESLRGRVFPQMLDRCKGVEIAVGRNLPALREAAASKLTRDAASSALKISAASAVVDNIPFLGFVMGAVTSAGDMVAITGLQVVLMMQIGAIYGKDPDLGRVWELLPVVGGGLGWRAVAREASGFIPVAGIAIKGAIAYAGTVVIGEGIGFFYEQGMHMTKLDAARLYDERKVLATDFARTLVKRLRGGG